MAIQGGLPTGVLAEEHLDPPIWQLVSVGGGCMLSKADGAADAGLFLAICLI